MRKRGVIITLLCLYMANDVIAQAPSTLNWRIAGQLPPLNGRINPGVAGAVIGVHNNILLVAGGANFPDQLPWNGGKKTYHQRVYLFDLQNKQWTALKSSTVLPMPLAYSANCTIKSGIVAVGGENEKGPLSSVYLITCNNSSDSIAIDTLPSLPVPTTNAVAVAIHESIYLLGGETSQGTTSDCWKLDLSDLNTGWTKIASLPEPRSFAYADIFLKENKYSIVFLGGRKKSTTGISQFSKAVYSYDPTKNTWIETASLPYPISAGTCISLQQQGIILIGGDTGDRFSQVEQKIEEISKADGKEKAALIQQKNELLTTHPGFKNEILFYQPVSEKTSLLGKLPFQTPVTTTALFINNQIIIPSGEIRAGIRTPDILMASIKFK